MLPTHVQRIEHDCAALPKTTLDGTKYSVALYRQLRERRGLTEPEEALLVLSEAELAGADELRLSILLRKAVDAFVRSVRGRPRSRRRR
jgi:hypothetical protein